MNERKNKIIKIKHPVPENLLRPLAWLNQEIT
jgi:hypothetical protein